MVLSRVSVCRSHLHMGPGAQAVGHFIYAVGDCICGGDFCCFGASITSIGVFFPRCCAFDAGHAIMLNTAWLKAIWSANTATTRNPAARNLDPSAPRLMGNLSLTQPFLTLGTSLLPSSPSSSKTHLFFPETRNTTRVCWLLPLLLKKTQQNLRIPLPHLIETKTQTLDSALNVE